ncbi:MAG: MATE family efflux transporter, partial [Porticoccaceae bacterium]
MSASSTFNIWRLTWPTILSNMAFMLTGLVFLKIAGGMGLNEVAAVTTGQRLFFILFAVMLGLSSGTTALVGRYWGANDKQRAGQIAVLSVIIFLLAGLTLSAATMPYLDYLVSIFELSAEAHILAIDFLF